MRENSVEWFGYIIRSEDSDPVRTKGYGNER